MILLWNKGDNRLSYRHVILPMSVRASDHIVCVPGLAAVRFSVRFQYQEQSHGKHAIIMKL